MRRRPRRRHERGDEHHQHGDRLEAQAPLSRIVGVKVATLEIIRTAMNAIQGAMHDRREQLHGLERTRSARSSVDR